MSTVRSPKNRITIASAGSRKTTQVVNDALSASDRRILITTFTNSNLEQIRRYLVREHGCVPRNITLLPWFTFLLQDCIRPYQRCLIPEVRIRSLYFDPVPKHAMKVARSDPRRRYLANDLIYRDRMAEFVCATDDVSGGLVVRRLERIYDHVFLDELQDISGWDYDLIDKLFGSSIAVSAVGDPRQTILQTSLTQKNSQYAGGRIGDWIAKHQKAGTVAVENRSDCYRCNQEICDFADALFPDMAKTTSHNATVTGHDGIKFVSRQEVAGYVKEFTPAVLRLNRAVDTMDLAAVNFGEAKGLTFRRVLIFPTKKMLKYLETKDLSHAGDLCKFYVAVTRAEQSVAFVRDVVD